jgi:hypothetical protein
MYNKFPICQYFENRNLNGGCKTGNFLFLFMGIVIFLFFILNSKYDNITKSIQNINFNQKSSENKDKKIQESENKEITVNINKDEKIQSQPSIGEIMRNYDYRTLNDPLVAPRRRDDYNLPVLPIPSRGFPSAFKKVGLLIDKDAKNTDKYKILLLMGRNKFPNSTSYEYYVVENDKNSSLKFDINRTRELQTDDVIEIHELNKKYNVVMDKMLGYEYDPYLY